MEVSSLELREKERVLVSLFLLIEGTKASDIGLTGWLDLFSAL
jgi:hypothetical protein